MVDISDKLEKYEALLRKWQPKINLVSNTTLRDIRARHIEDSLQMVPLIDNDIKSIADIGSGAGFPGLIIAMARPNIELTLIESDQRKCSFLRSVSRETNTPVNVLNERIENVTGLKVDLVTARALASLEDLMDYMQDLKCSKGLFLKGAQAMQEIKTAKDRYDFKYSMAPSKTSAEGCILSVTLGI
jgi:16S rRNA (guanine527-N7)-methyltransferase